MTAQQIWTEFIEKLHLDSLYEDDFTGDTKSFLISFLTGDSRKFRRDMIITANAYFDIGETKYIVIAECDDSEYRFDFIVDEGKWRLCFIECITIPIKNVNTLPFTDFPAVPEHETWIRAEKNISRTVYLYNRLKESFGSEKAIEWFLDGAGEFLAAKSWIPYFDDKRAFVAYIAWCENRLNGEIASIESFDNSKCVIRLKDHLWFKVYNSASHLKLMITESEYRNLFEHIWIDRAKQSGWNVRFEYTGSDTIIIFYI